MHYSFKSTPTWTMKGRPKSASAASPGPADYHPKKQSYRPASVSAVTQQRNIFNVQKGLPGPGAYQSKSYITDGPKRSMSARSTQFLKRTPGPQDYDNNSLKNKNKAPNYSMSTMSKSYHQMTVDNNSYKPAPTSYNFKDSFEKKNGVVIGTSIRKGLQQEQKTPGPNFYKSKQGMDYISKSQPKISLGTQSRKSLLINNQESPGPQAYDKKTIFQTNKDKKRGYSCRNRTADQIALQLSKYPGPGQYNSTLYNKPNAPRYASTSNLRKTFAETASNQKKGYPGPGQHNSSFNLSRNRSAQSYHFGKSNRKPLSDYERTPCPTSYRNDKKQVLNSAPKFSVTLGAKGAFQVNGATPGPADYDPNISLVKQNSKQYEVGKSNRPDFDKHRYTPGPGYYNLAGKLVKGWTFKKELRIAFTDLKSQSKFGNQYEIPNKVVDPPSYMKVQSKIKFASPSKSGYSTMNSAMKSPARIMQQVN